MVSIVQYRTYQRWVKEQESGIKPGRVGRPRKISDEVRQAIIRMAKENPAWGYLRIVGELLKLRCQVGKASVRRILREEGIYPKPTRPDRTGTGRTISLGTCSSGSTSIRWWPATSSARRSGRLSGKRDAYCLFFIHVGTRKAWVSPATYHPNEAWVRQQARNVLMWLEDQGLQATHLIHYRDTKFTASFDRLMGTAGIDIVKSPVMAPNANAFAEAWVASIKRECLNYFACFGLKHLDHLVQAYVSFYNTHRPHQGKGNQTTEVVQVSP